MSETAIVGIAFLTVSVVSGIGVLVYLAIDKLNLYDDIAGAIPRFIFTVVSGVVTFFLTNFLFGHGVEEASASGIATAAIIGPITKLTDSG